MNAFHMDTEHLLNGLKVFAYDTKPENKADLACALEIANILVAYKLIVYDGNVGGEQKKQIDQYMEIISERWANDPIQNKLEKRIRPIVPSNEKSITNDAVVDSLGWKDLSKFGKDPGFTTKLSSPQEYLFNYLGKDSLPESKSIEYLWEGKECSGGESKKIRGGRFFYSILRNETAYEKLSKRVRDNDLPVLQDLDDWFTDFRMDFASSRAACVPDIIKEVKACFALPALGRRKRKISFADELARKVSLMTGYDDRVGEIQYSINSSGRYEDYYSAQAKVLPMCLRIPLLFDEIATTPTPSTFLKCCFQAHENMGDRLQTIKKFTEEYEAMPNSDKGANFLDYTQELLNVKLDEEGKRNEELLKSMRWSLIATGVGLATGGPDAAVPAGVAVAVDRLIHHFGKWESREMKRAHIMAHTLDLLKYCIEDLDLLNEIFGAQVESLRKGDIYV